MREPGEVIFKTQYGMVARYQPSRNSITCYHVTCPHDVTIYASTIDEAYAQARYMASDGTCPKCAAENR